MASKNTNKQDRTCVTILTFGPGDLHFGNAITVAFMTQARVLFSCIIQNFNFFSRHQHEDLNLDEIKNALHSLPVNRETNLMNLIRPELDAKLLQ